MPLSGIQGLSYRQRLKGVQGRPANRWEDDLNDFVKDEETEGTQSNDLKNNYTWFMTAKNIYELKKKERKHAQHAIDD